MSKPHRFTNFRDNLARHHYSARNSNQRRNNFLNEMLTRQVNREREYVRVLPQRSEAR